MKNVLRSIRLWFLIFLPFLAVAGNDQPLPWTSTPNRATCSDEASFAWVVHSEGADCIRYFAGRNLSDAPVVVVIFSGDRDKMLKLMPEDIRNNTRRSQEAIAAKLSKQIDIPVVIVARPGTYGSSGDHRQRRQIREFLALDSALSSIRQRYGIGQFVLLGHSGGATAAAALLTLGRTDIRCAVMTSGAYDLLERARRRVEAAGTRSSLNRDTTGLKMPFDPLYKIDGIVRDEHRLIFVLGNPLDKITPFDLQKKFADAVAAAGHHVQLREEPAKEPSFHNLLGGVGLKTAAECAK